VKPEELDNQPPSQIAQALSIDPAAAEALSDEELGAILRHQLEAPLRIDLGTDDSAEDANITYGQLLSAAQPAVELLQRVQRFAKACKSHPDGPLPREVATVLYVATIVKAMLASGQRISALSDADVIAGVRWSLERAWIPASIRALLEAGMQKLDPPKP
jgi:hypothetical protein